MLSYQEMLLHQARYNELVHQAQRGKALPTILARGKRANRFHCRVLSWLGSRLVDWGQRLQARYSTTAIVMSNHKSQLIG